MPGGRAGWQVRAPARRAEEEDAPPPEHVGEPASGDDQDAEGEGVGVHHPLGG
jgi:hypothetical protein